METLLESLEFSQFSAFSSCFFGWSRCWGSEECGVEWYKGLITWNASLSWGHLGTRFISHMGILATRYNRTMPKISAPTVREHHEIVKERLIDATEQILREGGMGALSAGAVAAKAGIARNSIYRYVDSVDDLRLLMIARYVPRWRAAVFAEVDETADPGVRLEQFMVASLKQTGEASHTWLMNLMRTRGKSAGKRSEGAPKHAQEHGAARNEIANIHGLIAGFMQEQWSLIDIEGPERWAGFAGSLLYSAFQQVERGADIAEVAADLGRATRALVTAARS